MNWFFLLLFSFSLCACSIGKNQFSCRGYPKNKVCMSTEEIYAATSGNKDTNDMVLMQQKKITSGSQAGINKAYLVMKDEKALTPQRLSKAKALSIWIAPRHTKGGVFVDQGYIFVAIN